MKTFALAAVLLISVSAPWLATRAGAQGVDSCLCIWGAADSSSWLNPDTVMVDTCKAGPIFPPPSDEYVYSKRFDVIFQYAVIKLNAVRPDSILTVPWTAIDTAYLTFRNTCSQLASSYNGLWFTKAHPEIGDSTINEYDEFILSIGDYSQVNTIEDSLALYNGIFKDFFCNLPIPAEYGVKQASIQPKINLIFSDNDHAFLSDLEGRISYSISDQLGRTVLNGELETGAPIDLGSLVTGFYILRTEGAFAQCFKIFR